MRKLNIYYIGSVVTLAIMMLLMYRTLHITGWFEAQDTPSLTPAEQVIATYCGKYQPAGQEALYFEFNQVMVSKKSGEDDSQFLTVSLDTIPHFGVRVNDFEDEQVLLELYEIDSSGTMVRLDGCELLLSGDDSGSFMGSTIGNFCGLKTGSLEYLGLDLELNNTTALLQIASRGQMDSSELDKYLLERIDSR